MTKKFKNKLRTVREKITVRDCFLKKNNSIKITALEMENNILATKKLSGKIRS